MAFPLCIYTILQYIHCFFDFTKKLLLAGLTFFLPLFRLSNCRKGPIESALWWQEWRRLLCLFARRLEQQNTKGGWTITCHNLLRKDEIFWLNNGFNLLYFWLIYVNRVFILIVYGVCCCFICFPHIRQLQCFNDIQSGVLGMTGSTVLILFLNFDKQNRSRTYCISQLIKI